MADTSDTKVKFKTWFWNNIINKKNLDIKEGEDRDKNKLKLKIEKSVTVSSKVYKEIKWNIEEKKNFVRYIKLGQKEYQKDNKNLLQN